MNTVGLTPGTHQLCIRAKTATGTWGLYDTKKIKVLVSGNSIPIAEYFTDIDPGVGNGTPINLNANGEFSGGITFAGNLSAGFHQLYIRAKDYTGNWGLYDSTISFYNCIQPNSQMLSSTPTDVCGIESVTLSVSNYLAGVAGLWNWYKDSCNGEYVGSGSSLVVSPIDTTVYYVNGQGGCLLASNCNPITVNVNPSSSVKLKLFIQGYYDGGGMMTPALYNEGVVTCPNVTDTVDVELHDPITNALVDHHLSILQTDGTTICHFPNFVGDYRIAIKHRNAIQTWSANTIHLDNEISGYDFTGSAFLAYGDNMIEMESNIFALYNGDLNQDGAIDASDFLFLDIDIQSFANGYYASDLNGDGAVDASDFLILDANIQGFISSITP